LFILIYIGLFMSSPLVSIIMAGGLGKRMSPNKAKVLHEIKGYPMIYYVLQNALFVGCERIFIVVGKYRNMIENAVRPLFSGEIFKKFVFVIQPESLMDGELCSLGTGDAVRSCLSAFEEYRYTPNTNVLILSGDVPFVDRDELLAFSQQPNSMMVANVDDPTGYGRVFLNEDDQLSRIIEHAFCDETEILCTFVNAGMYNLTLRTLKETIPNIELHPLKKEFLLTDFYLFTETSIHIFMSQGVPQNINTKEDLYSIS